MAGSKQPIQVVMAKGKKHLTKSEIQERIETEIQPIADGICAPGYLTAKQKKEFDKYAEQLKKLRIMGETDVDTLARYIISYDRYLKATKQLNKKEVIENPVLYDRYLKEQNAAFNQCDRCSTKLGLDPASRCKLSVPQQEEEEKVNKFDKFKGTG